MPAYLICTREGPVTDPAAMARYNGMNRAQAAHFQREYGVQPLVVYGAQHVLEGDGPEGVVVLQFPDMASARRWYDSPEYQAALLHRQQGAPYRIMLVEGL